MSDLPNDAKSIFLAALDVQEPGERATFVARCCQGDEALRRRVEDLLRAYGESGGPLDKMAAAIAPTRVGEPIREQAGTMIGRYKLIELIGEGAMGSVWMAQQTEPVRRLVAIKLIKAGTDSTTVLTRFEAERQALALMDHPNIAKVLDGGATEHGSPYFAMELVKGVPITRYCDERRLTPRERLALFVPVCQAVQHAHQKGVIHRDLKPNNVLVAQYDGRPVPKVIDFGVAKAAGQPLTERTLVTGFGAIVGTPAYMSPEQAELNQLDIDTRSDIYALGVLLYELLTGSTPFSEQELENAGLLEILRVIREKEPPLPSTKVSTAEALPTIAANRGTEPKALTGLLRSELDWIVMRALEKDRNRRYETANSFAADIERYLGGEAVQAHPPSAVYRVRKLLKRNRGPFITAVAVLVALLGGAAVSTWQAAERKREQAERRTEQENAAARARQAVQSQLDRAEASLKDHRLSQVDGSLDQAEMLLADADAPELRERFAAVKKDLDMVRRLDDAFAWRWNLAKGQVRLFPDKAKEMFPNAFRQYGVTIGDQSAEAVVQMMRRSTIADALRLGLEQWFFLEPTQPGLQAVLDADDADSLRAAIRAAVSGGQRDRVSQLVEKAELSKFSPEFATSLGMYLPAERGLQIMKAAWGHRPDSFPLVITIAARLTELDVVQKGSASEAVGWSRTAVAMRPDSAFAHHCLGVAFGEIGAVDGMRAELHEAMRLAPRFARATFLLALDLFHQRKYEQALDLYQSMVTAQSHSVEGHAGLCQYYMRKERWDKAAEECLFIYDSLNDPAYNANDSCFDNTYSQATLHLATPIVIAGLLAEHRISEAFQFGEQIIQKSKERVGEYSACASGMFRDKEAMQTLTQTELGQIRRKALEWLSREVSDCAKNPSKENVQCIEGWLTDADLASVRDDKSLAALPAEERKGWRKLWAAVQLLHDRTAPAKDTSPQSPKR
jgi:serine/threonine protein kinase